MGQGKGQHFDPFPIRPLDIAFYAVELLLGQVFIPVETLTLSGSQTGKDNHFTSIPTYSED